MAQKSGEQAGKSGTPAGMHEAMKRATTEMLVLFLLRQKSMYAYEMIQEMARLTNGVMTFNTLYIAIYRLQEREFICEAEKRVMENRVRVYFAITEKGRKYLGQLMEEYTSTTRAIDALLAQDGRLYQEGGENNV